MKRTRHHARPNANRLAVPHALPAPAPEREFHTTMSVLAVFGIGLADATPEQLRLASDVAVWRNNAQEK